MFEEKVELGGAGGTGATYGSNGCSDESWDALLEGQEGPWAQLPASSMEHFKLPVHLSSSLILPVQQPLKLSDCVSQAAGPLAHTCDG